MAAHVERFAVGDTVTLVGLVSAAALNGRPAVVSGALENGRHHVTIPEHGGEPERTLSAKPVNLRRRAADAGAGAARNTIRVDAAGDDHVKFWDRAKARQTSEKLSNEMCSLPIESSKALEETITLVFEKAIDDISRSVSYGEM